MTTAQTLMSWLEPRLAPYIDELSQLCAFECFTTHKPGVDEAGAWVQRWAKARGWQVATYPDEHVGDSVVVTLRGTGTLRAMLVAHLDTVYPLGIAAERPARIEGESLLAPGAADNKSGLLSGLYALAALEDCGYAAAFDTLSVVCGSDEETDSHASATVLAQLAPHYDLALVLEAARENGDIVSARKGLGMFRFDVYGRAAHAGVEPEKGAHAVLALAHEIIALQRLNDTRPGLTVNVGVITGGVVPNAVPDHAHAVIDVRIARPEDAAPVAEAIHAIANAQHVAETSTVVGGGWSNAPMDRTPAIAALVDIAQQCADELGFAVRDTATGGVSYANPLAGLGLPVLDGLGPIGGQDHSPREHVLVPSIVPRTALLALLLLRVAEKKG